jgi:hypothetical protein
MKCEALGAMYGLPAGKRCNGNLAYGVNFDHIVLDANSKVTAWRTALPSASSATSGRR